MALDDFSLDLPPGQVVAIVGANGAGKSTLLRALATISPPEDGEILMDGLPLTRDNLVLRRRLMFLPDFPPLVYGRTILENLSMIMRLYEAGAPEAIPRITGLLKEFEILAVADRATGTLSRGMSYKAALTGLLAVDPDLWLLDEPFASGMDPAGINAFRRHAITAARERNRLVIFTTQILEAAERVADRICIIHRGRMEAFGTIAELRQQSGGDLFSLMETLREQTP